jgi:hypothetical protein
MAINKEKGLKVMSRILEILVEDAGSDETHFGLHLAFVRYLDACDVSRGDQIEFLRTVHEKFSVGGDPGAFAN